MEYAEQDILSEIEESVQSFVSILDKYKRYIKEEHRGHINECETDYYYGIDDTEGEQRLQRLLTNLDNIFSMVEDILPNEILNTVNEQSHKIEKLYTEKNKLDKKIHRQEICITSLQNSINNRKRGGRPPKTSPAYIKELKDNGYSVIEIAKKLKVSRQTVYENLKKTKQAK